MRALAARSRRVEMAAVDAAGGRSPEPSIETAHARIAAIDARCVALRGRARGGWPKAQASWRRAATRPLPSAVDGAGRGDASTSRSKTARRARRPARTEEDDTIVSIDDARAGRPGRTGELDRPAGPAEDAGGAAARTRGHPVRVQEAGLRRSALDLRRGQAGRRPSQRFPARRHYRGELLGPVAAEPRTGPAGRGQSCRPTSRALRPRKSGFSIPPGGFSPRPPTGGSWGRFSRPRGGGFGGGGFKSGGGFGGGGGFKTGGGF